MGEDSQDLKVAIWTGGLYIDYYDLWFEHRTLNQTAPVWNRNTRDFPSRREGFITMQEHGIPCVPNGLVKNMIVDDATFVVVYTDETMHQGLAKELLSAREAKNDHYDKWCSVFIRNSKGTISHRRLSIGCRTFLIEYQSNDSWRSNHQTNSIRVVDELTQQESERNLMHKHASPILAIDYVYDDKVWLATDFNLAPGMRGTGIEDVVNSRTAHKLIVDALREMPNALSVNRIKQRH
jgi:hypothetical protein